MEKNKRKIMIAYLSLASLCLSGCKSNTITNNENKTNIEQTTESTTITTTETTEEYINTTETTIVTTEKINNDDDKDLEIKENFDDYQKNLNELVENNDIDNIKKYGKEIFVNMVDFIFYDKEIRGIKFSELKEETKQDIYETFCDIDSLIIRYCPDYKENIGEKYEAVKDFASKAYYKTLDVIKEKIGEENYEKVKETKDNFKEKAKDGTENVKKYIKEKYENWRDK